MSRHFVCCRSDLFRVVAMPKRPLTYVALSATCFAVAAVVALAREYPALPNKAPTLLVVESPVHDFGRVRQQETLEATFSLKNESNATLRVMDVATDCGCTVAEVDSRLLHSGESSALRVHYETGTGRGPVERRVAVWFTIEAQGEAKILKALPLAVRADIRPDFRFELRSFAFAMTRTRKRR